MRHVLFFLATMAPAFAFAQTEADHSFEFSGQFRGFCGSEFYLGDPVEGMPIRYRVQVSLDLMMGEPVIRSTAQWRAYRQGKTCIKPFVGKEIIEVADLAALDPENKSHPYNLDLVLELIGAGTGGDEIFMHINPGAISEVPGEDSFNTPGARDWSRMFFRMAGRSRDFHDESLYEFLPKENAQAAFAQSLDLIDHQAVKVDFNLNPIKSGYAELTRRAKMETKVVDNLVAWGKEADPAFPARYARTADLNRDEDPQWQIEEQQVLRDQVLSYLVSADLSDAHKAELDMIQQSIDQFAEAMANSDSAFQRAATGDIEQASLQLGESTDKHKAELMQVIRGRKLPGMGQLKIVNKSEEDSTRWVATIEGELIRPLSEDEEGYEIFAGLYTFPERPKCDSVAYFAATAEPAGHLSLHCTGSFYFKARDRKSHWTKDFEDIPLAEIQIVNEWAFMSTASIGNCRLRVTGTSFSRTFTIATDFTLSETDLSKEPINYTEPDSCL